MAGNPKALYYRLPQLYANVAIASQHISQDTIELYLINDSFESVSGQFSWNISKLDGTLIHSAMSLVSVHPNSSIKAAVVVLPKGVKSAGDVFLEGDFAPENGEKVSYLTYFVKPKALNLSKQPLQVKTEYGDHFAEIHLSAKQLQKGVFIEEAHGYQVKYSNNYFDLKPNKEVIVHVEYPLLDEKPTFKVRAW